MILLDEISKLIEVVGLASDDPKSELNLVEICRHELVGVDIKLWFSSETRLCKAF